MSECPGFEAAFTARRREHCDGCREKRRLEQENRELREERDNLAAWQKEALPKFTEYSARAQAAEDRLAQVLDLVQGLKSYLGQAGQDADHAFMVRTYIAPALTTSPTRQESARECQEHARRIYGCRACEAAIDAEAAASRPATAQAGRCEPECDDPICARIGHFGLPVDLCRNDACHLVGEHERDDYCPPEPPAGEYPPVDLMEAIKAGLKAREPEPPAGEEKP